MKAATIVATMLLAGLTACQAPPRPAPPAPPRSMIVQGGWQDMLVRVTAALAGIGPAPFQVEEWADDRGTAPMHLPQQGALPLSAISLVTIADPTNSLAARGVASPCWGHPHGLAVFHELTVACAPR